MRTVALLLLCACGPSSSPCPKARVTSAGGAERVSVCYDTADTAAARARGLTGTDLPRDQGLVLAFPFSDAICIVNGTVPYAIDAVYADPDGIVVAAEKAIPGGDATPRCHPGVQSVLEVRAGVAAGVETGDVLRLDPVRS